MALIVQKYGGSSLATPQHIRRAALRIRDLKRSGKDVVAVVSAMGRMTDHLIRLAHKTVESPHQRELDMLLSAGERISMALLAMALEHFGVPAISFTGSQSGIVTSSDHTNARIRSIRGHRIREELKRGRVVIIAGFQGVSEEKEITTLGRGGSDTTAVALAADLQAERCDILTDVDGLYSADPRMVSNAVWLDKVSYDIALELASLGAKMQSRSIELAKRFRVPVRIASSHNISTKGTELVDTKKDEVTMEDTVIRGIAGCKGFHFFRTSAKWSELLDSFQKLRVQLRFFNYSGDSLSFLVEENKTTAIRDFLATHEFQFNETPKVAIVSAVGDGVSSCVDVLPQFVKAVGEVGATCLLICTNSLSVTAAVEAKFLTETTNRLHERLIAEKAKEKVTEVKGNLSTPPPYLEPIAEVKPV